MSEPQSPERAWLIDGHVHVHDCFDRERFLAAAAANFAAARSGLPPHAAGTSRGVLMLTESAGAAEFRRLRDAPALHGTWVVRPTAEPESLEIERDGAPCLVVIAGRQVVTAESLEVLALGCDAEPADGRPIGETIETVRRAGALPVVPWGFGKWWLARGTLVRALLEAENPAGLFLGDNGGRPRLGRRPRLFDLAERRGFRVLPGSDPLPLPSHVDRAGSYGFLLLAAVDAGRPAAAIKAALRDPAARPLPYGRGQPLLPFVRNQLAMQWHKRRPGVAA